MWLSDGVSILAHSIRIKEIGRGKISNRRRSSKKVAEKLKEVNLNNYWIYISSYTFSPVVDSLGVCISKIFFLCTLINFFI